MATLEKSPIWRYGGMLVVILAMLVGGTWMTVKLTTEHLLYQNATHTAENWAQYLAANVSDLEQIAAGETPSSASIDFFNSTRKAGEVFRYVIFNRYGYSILRSERDKVTPVDLSEYSAAAANSIKGSHPIVDAKSGQGPGQPSYFSEAYVPVLISGRPVAVVAAYVNQTAEHNSYYRTFLIAAVSLCLANRVLIRAAGHRVVPANEGKAASRSPYPLSRPSRCADRPRQSCASHRKA